MAAISHDDVKKLAALSNIYLSEDEIEQYQKEIATVLEFVKKLDKVDTSGVKPTTQVNGRKNATRKDEVDDYGVSREDLLKNTPDQKDGYIKVRRVL